MPLTVLDGSTFCVCDERGDVDGTRDRLRLLRRRHALPLALRADGRRRAAGAALARAAGAAPRLVRPAQPARRRPAAERALDRARAVRRRLHAGADHGREPRPPPGRVRARRSSSRSTSPTSSSSRASTRASASPATRRCRAGAPAASAATRRLAGLRQTARSPRRTVVHVRSRRHEVGRRRAVRARARAGRELGARRSACSRCSTAARRAGRVVRARLDAERGARASR